MTAPTKDCTGCAHAKRRLKWSQPRTYCTRYHLLPESRCIDYAIKPPAIRVALDFLKGGRLIK